jgi:predicted Holliday junction resolvase-like endonuclease
MPVVEPVSIALQISPAALLAATGIILVIVICVQLTISISGMQQQIRKLSEEVSLRQVLLEKQIRTNGEQKNNNE